MPQLLYVTCVFSLFVWLQSHDAYLCSTYEYVEYTGLIDWCWTWDDEHIFIILFKIKNIETLFHRSF